MMKRILTIAVVVLALFAFGSCGADTDKKDEVTEATTTQMSETQKPIAEATVDFSSVGVKDYIYGYVGEDCEVDVEGAEGFCSSKLSVAEVDESGKINCKKAGVTLIGYTQNGEEAAVAVCVFEADDGPEASSAGNPQIIEAGKEFFHTAPIGGVEYTSSDDSICDVSEAPRLLFKESGYVCVTCASASRPFTYSFIVYDRIVEK